jgi:hypothetical protein
MYSIHKQELAIDAFEKAHSTPKKRVFLQTARAFLGLLKNLRVTILQDAAVLMLQGRTHAVFNLPVFKSDEFIAFKESMRVHLDKFEDKDPLEADWNRLVPGLHEQISNTMSAIDSGFNQLNTKMESFVTKDYLNQLIATLGSNIIRSVPTDQTHRGITDVQADGSPNFTTYRVPDKFTTVTAMHTEWLTSIHHFHTEGTPARKHWRDFEKKRYNRVKRVIDLVLCLEAKYNSIPLASILSQLDHLFKTHCNGSISAFITWSSKNAIQIKSPPTTSPTATTTTQITQTMEV